MAKLIMGPSNRSGPPADADEELGGIMQLEREGEGIRVRLNDREAYLLKRALERASFIDTPVAEQEEIAGLCARVLEALGTHERP
jgi:hypothetical protein